MKHCLTVLINFYQAAISPFMGHCCRFDPTCSEYAKEVIQKYGARKGGIKALRRLLCCHPFYRGGKDKI